MPHSTPVRIAVLNDYAVIVAGMTVLLAGYPERVLVVEAAAAVPVLSDVDVVLYDTFGRSGRIVDLDRGPGTQVVVFSWVTHPAAVRAALDHGAAGYLSKGLTAAEVVDAVERVHGGEVVVLLGSVGDQDVAVGDWPGRTEGLAAREAEVIALVCQGRTNPEIATQLFVSVNTVKTYIRSAYRKMDVTSRSQAVLWALAFGFEPDRVRAVAPGAPGAQDVTD